MEIHEITTLSDDIMITLFYSPLTPLHHAYQGIIIKPTSRHGLSGLSHGNHTAVLVLS